MLRLTIPEQEAFNDDTQEFSFTKEVTLQLEHSLVSISKWEAKWHIPFLRREPMTREQTIDYIRCMTITQNVPKEAYEFLTNENIKTVMAYIDDSMTATTVRHRKKSTSRDVITSELIYYWMVTLNIPSQYEKWHLNRLLTLIDVCNAKNGKPEKMSRRETADEYRSINARRRAEAKLARR